MQWMQPWWSCCSAACGVICRGDRGGYVADSGRLYIMSQHFFYFFFFYLTCFVWATQVLMQHRLLSNLSDTHTHPEARHTAEPQLALIVTLNEWQPAAPQAPRSDLQAIICCITMWLCNVGQQKCSNSPPCCLLLRCNLLCRWAVTWRVSLYLQPNDQLSPKISGASIIFRKVEQEKRHEKWSRQVEAFSCLRTLMLQTVRPLTKVSEVRFQVINVDLRRCGVSGAPTVCGWSTSTSGRCLRKSSQVRSARRNWVNLLWR